MILMWPFQYLDVQVALGMRSEEIFLLLSQLGIESFDSCSSFSRASEIGHERHLELAKLTLAIDPLLPCFGGFVDLPHQPVVSPE